VSVVYALDTAFLRESSKDDLGAGNRLAHRVFMASIYEDKDIYGDQDPGVSHESKGNPREDKIREYFDILTSKIDDLVKIWAEEDGRYHSFSIVLSTPEAEDCPVIAVLRDFEEISGRSWHDTIGRPGNLPFSENEAVLDVLRDVQASELNTRRFIRTNPAGRSFVVVNQRPARTSKNEKPCMFFYNNMLLFGTIVHPDPDDVAGSGVLVCMHWRLTEYDDIEVAQARLEFMQMLLMQEEHSFGQTFHSWAGLVLAEFLEHYVTTKMVEKGPPVPSMGKVLTMNLKAALLPTEETRGRMTLLLNQLANMEADAQRWVNLDQFMQDGEEDEDFGGAAPGEQDSGRKSKTHLAVAQVADLLALREGVCEEFAADLRDHIAWYSISNMDKSHA
jgi:hypothetical protein